MENEIVMRMAFVAVAIVLGVFELLIFTQIPGKKAALLRVLFLLVALATWIVPRSDPSVTGWMMFAGLVCMMLSAMKLNRNQEQLDHPSNDMAFSFGMLGAYVIVNCAVQTLCQMLVFKDSWPTLF